MGAFNRQVLQIGVGGFGQSWVKRLADHKPEYQVVDIVDISADALRDAGEKLGVPKEHQWQDPVAALQSTTAELVVIITPPSVHCVQTLAALDAGKHVILAKPMAPSWSECVEMVAAAQRAGRVLAIEQNYRYFPENLQFRDVLSREQAVGEVDLEFFINADFGETNFRTLMRHPLTLDMMIHHADLLRFFTGADAEWVIATEYNPAWSWYQCPAALRMLIGLSNGAVASYRGCWASGGAATNWSGNWRCQTAERRTLIKTASQIELWESDGWGRTPKMTPIPYEPAAFGGTDCLTEVTAAIDEGRESATSGLDNLQSIAIVLAAVTSAQENGAKVPVPKWNP